MNRKHFLFCNLCSKFPNSQFWGHYFNMKVTMIPIVIGAFGSIIKD